MGIPLKQYGELLVAYLRPQRGRVLLLALFLFSSIGLQLVNPQIMRRFLDVALAGGEGSGQLGWMALLFIGVALVQQGRQDDAAAGAAGASAIGGGGDQVERRTGGGCGRFLCAAAHCLCVASAAVV